MALTVLQLPVLALGSSDAAGAAFSQYMVYSCGLPVLGFAFFLCSSACRDLAAHTVTGGPLIEIAEEIMSSPKAVTQGNDFNLLDNREPGGLKQVKMLPQTGQKTVSGRL
jgi:hypothetical protein